MNPDFTKRETLEDTTVWGPIPTLRRLVVQGVPLKELAEDVQSVADAMARLADTLRRMGGAI